MTEDEFKGMVARLERESALAPMAYRAKVAALTVLGFAIFLLLLGTAGLGLLLLVFLAYVLAFGGTGGWLVLLKLGKLLWWLALPMWLLLKSSWKALWVRWPEPAGLPVLPAEAPALFEALADLRKHMRGPRFHRVLLTDEVNAAVVQRPRLGLFGWPKNYLLLGLPLLDSMPAEEALAVVAHEYGHLAGAHARFGAFIYRLRHSWGTVQDLAEQVQGWLARLVVPLVRWYAPYFNAYTFVLARAHEYKADAAAAELVGVAPVAHALQRVNVVGPAHDRFMDQALARVRAEPAPPNDLLSRWAQHATTPFQPVDATRWLGQALDRPGHFADSHPTLRARLNALSGDIQTHEPPPPWTGASAAQAWLGAALSDKRAALQAQWQESVERSWSERHAEFQADRQRLRGLRELREPTMGDQLELMRLSLRLEPETDWREPFQAFNQEHPDHPVGLFFEGAARLDRLDSSGLDLLEAALTLDIDFTKPVCERAHRYCIDQGDLAKAQLYRERWNARDAFEAARDQELKDFGPKAMLEAPDLDAQTLAEVRAQLESLQLKLVAEIYLARRRIAADPTVIQWVMGVRLNWWGKWRSKQKDVIDRLAGAPSWPIAIMFFTLDGRLAPLRKTLKALPGARLR